ncbi:CobQ/CobB/MinD/ParA nucleotide binding domain-containing protein [Halogranum gelatinilyticum]|uniref:CobQ/CobB/MinD/ParA nucleotide binding domain-containing protein n=1 Tax=Halogranum gelatinilyticum TaxID=660521 RepID=A0A1G9PEK2_9EURY|nr:AAA family ATPase [Halogranum gelatinilyticum]SDL96983.1 CobQ/CobB/MinD/ParA nucleotide binding domain-containing protein [Halogranum gelatinilyticum]
MPGTTTALVGATGGAGTTRTAVELAAMLARDGRDVAVLDAAYATQGLSHYVSGRIDPDLTTLVTESAEPLDAGLVDLDVDTSGRVACCPVSAPFERLARAKTADAAQRFEERVAEAAQRFDHVLVDTPPVAANQAVAAVTSVDRVVLVTPGTRHGADALQQMRGRLRDLDVTAAATLSTRGAIDDADATVPASDVTEPDDAPACLADSGEFAPAVAVATEVAVDEQLAIEFDDEGLRETVESYLPE